MKEVPESCRRGPKRYELAMGVLGAPGLLLLAPAGSLAPYIGPFYGWVLFMGPGIGFLLVLFAAGCLVLAIVERPVRRWLPIALVFVALGGALFHPGVVDASWRSHFERDFVARDEAARWAASQEPSDRRLPLPAPMSTLSEGGFVYVHRDESGGLWAAFPIVTYGIDDSVGYVWSRSGEPPPEAAYPQLVRWSYYRAGWYMFWST
jgi:hypothetical protein